uniref:Ubiquitin-like protease family profile domain-containing protein n=1 Tax=Anopheles atroparvus TaxID=41427 RepID=A0A182J7R5_ANOAO
MIPEIISRLKQIITGGGENKDPPGEAGHHGSMAGVTQNGAHPYASSTVSSNVRRFSDLTDSSQVNNVDGVNEDATFSTLRTAPLSRTMISSRSMAKRSTNGPPMLIPIKTTAHAGSSVIEEYLRSGSQYVSRQQNGEIPTQLRFGGHTNPVVNIDPELTNEFRNVVRTKCSLPPYRTVDQSTHYVSDHERKLSIQHDTREAYEKLMKNFIPLSRDPLNPGAKLNSNRGSLNGDIQRSSMQKDASIEKVGQSGNKDDDRDEAENTKCGQLFTTIDSMQLLSMVEGGERESRKPPTEMVNSIQDKFQTKHVFRDNIIQDVQQRYGSFCTSRKSLIEQEKERVSRFTRNTQEQEGQTRNNMFNYICSSYKFEFLDDLELEEAAQKGAQEVPLPALTQAQLDLIHRKLRSGNEVVADKFNLKIRGSDLVTLQGTNWLNDEVINFYMELLRERSELKHDQGLPKVYTMNTFFLPRLLQTGHSGVRRWTRKVDLLAYDMIVVPVHVNGIHWCMSIVDLRRKTIHYYDSMGSPNNAVLNALECYLAEESLDKRKTPFDTSGFTKANIRECPRQENGSDCGVFSCMFAEFLTRDHPITFDQSKMQYFRQKMMVEIVTSQLLT